MTCQEVRRKEVATWAALWGKDPNGRPYTGRALENDMLNKAYLEADPCTGKGGLIWDDVAVDMRNRLAQQSYRSGYDRIRAEAGLPTGHHHGQYLPTAAEAAAIQAANARPSPKLKIATETNTAVSRTPVAPVIAQPKLRIATETTTGGAQMGLIGSITGALKKVSLRDVTGVLKNTGIPIVSQVSGFLNERDRKVSTPVGPIAGIQQPQLTQASFVPGVLPALPTLGRAIGTVGRAVTTALAAKEGVEQVTGFFNRNNQGTIMAGVDPEVERVETRRCPKGYVLAVDGRCYPKQMLPRSWRMHQPAPKPVVSRADQKAIRRADSARKRLVKLTKAAGAHASMTKPRPGCGPKKKR